jgi:hypothetical protein
MTLVRTSALLLSIACAACGGEDPSAPAGASAKPASAGTGPQPPGEAVGRYEPGASGGQALAIGGVTIRLASDVPDRPTGEGGFTMQVQNGIGAALRGWPIVLRDGHVFVGGQDFGAAPEGSKIEIANDGVRVDGELRGELPQ